MLYFLKVTPMSDPNGYPKSKDAKMDHFIPKIALQWGSKMGSIMQTFGLGLQTYRFWKEKVNGSIFDGKILAVDLKLK